MVRSILHKEFPQEKYETLQERDVNADDEWCLDFLNTMDGWMFELFIDAQPQYHFT